MMKFKSKTAKKVTLGGVALLAFATGLVGLTTLSHPAQSIAASADTTCIVDVTAADTFNVLGGQMTTNMHGAASVWKMPVTAGFEGTLNLGTNGSPTGVNTAGAKGIQFRVFSNLGTITGEVEIEVKINGVVKGYIITDAGICEDGNEGRYLTQGQWFNFVVQGDAGGTINNVGFKFNKLNATAPEGGAYFLLDSVSVINDGTPALAENVITDFTYNELNSGNGGWRSDLATNVDTDNDGVVDAESALIFAPRNNDTTFKLATPYDMTDVVALQFRMYMHLGEVNESTPTIWMHANGTGTHVAWGSNSVNRIIVQDEWVTFTVTNELHNFGGSFSSYKISATGVNGLADDAYILIDSITAVKATANAEDVYTEFAVDQIDPTNAGGTSDYGWFSNATANEDTDKDGKVDCENGVKLNLTHYMAGTYPSIKFMNPVDVSKAKTLTLRAYVHWGKVIDDKVASLNILAVGKDGAEHQIAFLATNDKLVQDQWIDINVSEKDVAALGGEISKIVVGKGGAENVIVDNYGYIIFDSISKGDFSYVKGASLSLEGDIGVNFYTNISSKTLADKNAKVQLKVGENVKEVLVSEGVAKDGYLVYTYNVAAKDYKDNVTIVLPTGETATCSVESYAKMIADSAEYTEKAKALVASLVDYCEAARVFFAGETAEAKFAEVTKAQVEANKATLTGTQEGVTVIGASLVLETKTSIRVYFKDVNATKATVKVDDKEVKAVEYDAEANIYYVEISNIVAKDLDNTYTVTIGGITVTYSALSYVHSTIEGADVALANAVKALYLYNVQANTYFA